MGARTVDTADVINPGKDFVDTNKDDKVPMAEITNNEGDNDVVLVLDNQNINRITTMGAYMCLEPFQSS